MNTKKSSAFGQFFKKFKYHRLAVAGLVFLCAEILLITFLPMILELDPYSVTSVFKAVPSSEHILGTDTTGRDLFARLIYGGRTTLFVGFTATACSVAIGLPLGLIAGYYRGAAETVIMRLADIFQSFPSIVLVLVMVAIFGNSLAILIFLIGVLSWPQTARLIHARVLTVRKMEYIEAGAVGGENNFSILLRHVLPNSIAPLWMNIAFQVSSAMLTESALSFLGAGVQPPTASWGNIIHEAVNVVVLYTTPWIWIPSGIFLILTVVSINFIGEGVRDALDPKMKR